MALHKIRKPSRVKTGKGTSKPNPPKPIKKSKGN